MLTILGTGGHRRWTVAVAAALCCGACAAPGPVTRFESPAARALPEADPGLRGMVQGARTMDETEQVTVRLTRTPEGKVVVAGVLSPGLTPQQEEAIRRGLESGEWRREAPLSPAEESWLENVVRVRR